MFIKKIISFQDRPDKWYFGQTSGLQLLILFFMPPELQTSDFGR